MKYLLALLAVTALLFAAPLVIPRACHLVDGGAPQEVMLDPVLVTGPDQHDDIATYLQDRYLILLHQYHDSVAVMDSLRLKLARYQVRQ
jgi:hypothetical protein